MIGVVSLGLVVIVVGLKLLAVLTRRPPMKVSDQWIADHASESSE